MNRLPAAFRPEGDQEIVVLAGLLLLAVGLALWWLPAALIVPGAILTAIGVVLRASPGQSSETEVNE